MRYAAAVSQDDGRYVAQCLELDIAGEGATREAAIASLKAELERYLGSAPAVGPPAGSPHIGPVEVVVAD